MLYIMMQGFSVFLLIWIILIVSVRPWPWSKRTPTIFDGGHCGTVRYYNASAEVTSCGKISKYVRYGGFGSVGAVARGYWTATDPTNDEICGKRVYIQNPRRNFYILVYIYDICEDCTMDEISIGPGPFASLEEGFEIREFQVKWAFKDYPIDNKNNCSPKSGSRPHKDEDGYNDTLW